MRSNLTVIVPNYNKSEFLKKCVESIEAQSLKPEAVIIVDDGSTDDSRSVIDALTKTYPDVRAHYKPRNTDCPWLIQSISPSSMPMIHTAIRKSWHWR